jgi:hypothetical protein
MMRKLLPTELENFCTLCPALRGNHRQGWTSHWSCVTVGRRLDDQSDAHEIPDWCPLPAAPSEKGGEK